MQVGLHGFREEGPGVLQICDRHHRNNAGNQLRPSIDNTRRVNQGTCGFSHRQTSIWKCRTRAASMVQFCLPPYSMSDDDASAEASELAGGGSTCPTL